MKPGMRMMMMDRIRQNERYPRSEYSGGDGRRMIGYDRDYDTESRRRRDDRGRYMKGEDWQEDHVFPRYDGYGPEARRHRDGRGRYMMNGDYDDGDDMRGQTWFPPYGYMPPQSNMMHPGNSYGDIYAHGTIYAPGAANKPVGQDGSEHHHGEMDEQTARHWVRKMRNADGTPSPHWQPEQVEPLRMQHCPDCSKWEFWAAMNMMYADYGNVAKKMGVDKPEYYACMVKAFVEDPDAKDNKLLRYMQAVAE